VTVSRGIALVLAPLIYVALKVHQEFAVRVHGWFFLTVRCLQKLLGNLYVVAQLGRHVAPHGCDERGWAVLGAPILSAAPQSPNRG
jgi:heme A synthase